ncbi:MAG: GFA family protein, partial [Candidatus Competibacterales bacterium]|nr:GFA family protein [Candidatus Competibacterales bacterium]
GCLCGAVRYRARGPLRPVIACHCRQCRRSSGHYVAATAAALETLALEDPLGSLRWYRSSPEARRGFCGRCGSSLLWQRDGAATVSLMAGTLDGPTGLTTVAHIYVADRGDYYDLPGDGTLRCEAADHGVEWPLSRRGDDDG